MPFDYEQSIWGEGVAELSYGSPTFFRLRQALDALRGAPETGKILEVGAGAGQFIRAVKRECPNWRCYGVDISQEAVKVARAREDGVTYNLATASALPYADSTFDAVLVLDVLEHAADPARLLREIGRVLRPKGVFYCFVPCEGDLLSLWRWLDFLGLKKGLTEKYAGHINFFKRKEIAKLLRGSNFQINHVRYSEHLFGQLVGVAAFILMDRNARRRGGEQVNNEKFFTEAKKRGGWLSRAAAYLGNWIVNLESVLFCRLPSPNIHVVSVNKK